MKHCRNCWLTCEDENLYPGHQCVFGLSAPRQNLETDGKEIDLKAGDVHVFLSVVTMAEIQVLTAKRGWGESRMRIIREAIENWVVADIEFQAGEIVDAFVKIDLYSRRHPKGSHAGPSITMGKNDLWIAATAYVYQSTLLTADKGFLHLSQVFFPVQLISEV